MRDRKLIPSSQPGRALSAAGRLLGRARRITDQRTFAPLIDSKAAGELLGVPHTWLLAQARAGRIPHHRLGHYVRFNPHDLEQWLKDTRQGPPVQNGRGSREP